jgi:hypothetical protein
VGSDPPGVGTGSDVGGTGVGEIDVGGAFEGGTAVGEAAVGGNGVG